MKKLFAAFAVLAFLAPGLVFAQAQVTEAKLGKDVVDRQIVDESKTFALNEKAFLWMRIEGAADETINVTWTNGENNYPVSLNIGANPWRTWSSKLLHIPGEWAVAVTDAAGRPLYETTFNVE
jgi:hypothetical protein